MTERQNPFSIPQEDWQKLHNERVIKLKQLEKLLQTSVTSDEALTFLYGRLDELIELSGNPVDELTGRPKFVELLSVAERGGQTYRLQRGEAEHTPQTLYTAAILFARLNVYGINAVKGVNINQLTNKALFMSTEGKAQIEVGNGRKIRFPSPVPGFAATLWFRGLDARPRSVVIEPAVKI